MEGQNIGLGVPQVAVEPVGKKPLGFEMVRGREEAFFKVAEVADLLADQEDAGGLGECPGASAGGRGQEEKAQAGA